MDTHTILDRKANGQSVHKRLIARPDGREVMLYGYEEHRFPVCEDFLDGGAKDSHLRWHPLRQEWSVYAAGRQNRTFKPSQAENPLAPTVSGGAVTEVPVESFELAIFENRFPSFSAQTDDQTGSNLRAPEGIKTGSAAGRCEVVVYTPESVGNLGTLSQSRRELLVSAWIDRYDALYGDGAQFVLPFENRGEAVGVTLLHPHGQIYAFPVIPRVQRDAAEAFSNGYQLTTALNEWGDDFLIAEAGGVVAVAPPFAKYPYEVWVLPTQRRAHLNDFSTEEQTGFATLLGEVTNRYDAFFSQDTPYMMGLHASPVGHEDTWHFTAQFYPILRSADKIKYLASVEQSTGLFTVDVMPEDTVKALRS